LKLIKKFLPIGRSGKSIDACLGMMMNEAWSFGHEKKKKPDWDYLYLLRLSLTGVLRVGLGGNFGGMDTRLKILGMEKRGSL